VDDRNQLELAVPPACCHAAFRGICSVAEIQEFLGWRATKPWSRYGIALLAFIVSFSIRVGMDVWLSSDRGFILS
jgi:hypothetical protein